MMVAFDRIVRAEARKALHSPVPWITGLVVLLFPLIAAGFMAIVRDPEGAKALGILGTKARLSGLTADWPSYLGFINQTLAAGFLFLEALFVSWLFGREWSDRTVKLLLAVPAGRGAVVAGKLVVVGVWGVLVLVLFGAVAASVGYVLNLPQGSPGLMEEWAGKFTVGGLLTLSLGTGTAFFASVGRGYLVPLAWTLVTLMLAQFGAVLGWAAVTPWAIPAQAAGLTGSEGAGPASVALVLATSALGTVATVLFWKRADHPR